MKIAGRARFFHFTTSFNYSLNCNKTKNDLFSESMLRNDLNLGNYDVKAALLVEETG